MLNLMLTPGLLLNWVRAKVMWLKHMKVTLDYGLNLVSLTLMGKVELKERQLY